jgi:hypothetical protein
LDIHNFRDQNVLKYNFPCWFAPREEWTLIKGGRQSGGVENSVQSQIFGLLGLEETVQCGASLPVLLQQLYLGNQIKNNEVYRACGANRRVERCIQGSAEEVGEKEITWKT